MLRRARAEEARRSRSGGAVAVRICDLPDNTLRAARGGQVYALLRWCKTLPARDMEPPVAQERPGVSRTVSVAAVWGTRVAGIVPSLPAW